MIPETWAEVPSCHCVLLSSTEGEMSEGTGAQGTRGAFLPLCIEYPGTALTLGAYL